jgi:hypothetical protein
VGRWREKICDKQQQTDAKNRQGFCLAETISLTEGMQDIVAGRWRGIGLLDVLGEYMDVFGQKVLIVEHGIDRRRLQAHYPRTTIFSPAEFLDIMEHWPESSGIVQAKRAFAGDVMSGVA